MLRRVSFFISLVACGASILDCVGDDPNAASSNNVPDGGGVGSGPDSAKPSESEDGSTSTETDLV